MPQVIACFQRHGDQLRSTAVILGGFMEMRRPSSAPNPVKQPSRLTASAGGIQPTFRRSLDGDGLERLTGAAVKRALALILGRPRSIRTTTRPDGLNTFLALSRDPLMLRCALDTRFGMAIVAPDGRSVAAVTRSVGRPTTGRIEAWGDDHAERILAEHIQRWQDAGRPAVEDLHLAVSYSARPPGNHWRNITRYDSIITLDWYSSSQ